ncbi:TRAP transporter fused permease subunit [Microvirga sp. HBU67558]|uniref:TRAP transporter permease n=1 Tax=Microvirga TaxID=186650 RepID=UPI001B39774D|nr:MULTISPECIES: TRAP transporter fused permease subunit [unclassified Microvirga]MBQ0821236.1 TRAP transporter fused permease subunit [Microvirga sp. HBU67558]
MMRQIEGVPGAILGLWSVGAVLLHLYFAGYGYPEPLELAALHLALFVPPVFFIFPASPASPKGRPTVLDGLLAVGAFVPNVYIYFNQAEIYERTSFIDPLTPIQYVLGTAMVLTVVEATRRSISYTLAGLVLLVIGYMAVCHLLPGAWYSRPLSFAHITEINFLSVGSGLYGSLTVMSATIVASFLIFGSLMQASGMSRLFGNFGAVTGGRFTGGPAKVAVISSALFGTMSGSSVANVVVTGSMSIPLMKRLGFRPVFAAGIEAASSVGGPLMPPVMGAAAFIMSEMIAVPYSAIIIAAAMGAILYYVNILTAVHYESKKLGIGAIPRRDLPSLRDLGRDAHLVLPLALLVTLMMMRFSPYLAAFWATIATVAVAALRRHTRMGPRVVFVALRDGGYLISMIAVAVTSAGIITAALTNTGLLLAFTGMIKAAAGGSLLLLALLIAGTCLFLGVGIPTTPAYIITAAIGAPLIAEHGVPLIAIHLFIFYFAVLADASPPVAPVADAAATIAGSPPMKTGFYACRFALGGFVTGLAYIYEPGLILSGSLFDIGATAAALATGLVLISAGLVGYAWGPLPAWLRLGFITAGCFCSLWYAVPVWQRGAVGVALVGAMILISRSMAARESNPPLQPALASHPEGEVQ